jgi:hypothetical protein
MIYVISSNALLVVASQKILKVSDNTLQVCERRTVIK